MKILSKTMAAALTLFAFLGIAVQSAYAWNPTLTATATCGTNNVAVINYTVHSWTDTPGSGENPLVNVYFNGVVVDHGAFFDPTYQFSGTVPAPANATNVDVQAIAVGTWGDGTVSPISDSSSNVVNVTIPTNCAPALGRFTGGGKQVLVDYVTITKGFEVDCDLHEPSNNLEVNWGGNHFHMLTFTSAVCTLTGSPKPPKAPVNMIVGTGTGRYNGMDGYTVEFTLIDNGEPGTQDAAGFKVYPTGSSASPVLDVPVQLVTTGNIQAHVDQK